MQHVSCRGQVACGRHGLMTAAEAEISSMLPASTALSEKSLAMDIVCLCHAGS